jgi:hypothetical protein
MPDEAPSIARPPRRRDVLAAAAGMAALLAGCGPGLPVGRQSGAMQLRLLGQTVIPHRLEFRGTTVGGLSAIDHDPATGLFDLLSDDRSDLQSARLYRARLGLTAQGLAPPEFVEVITLRQPDGSAFPGRSAAPAGLAVPDPESLRRLPSGNFLWTSEGDFARGFAPAVYEADRQGRQLRAFELPPCFAEGPGHGARDNLAFEGLALNASGTQAWVAMENALQQDGAVPSLASGGGPCRFTLFDVATGTALRQIAYPADAIPAAPLIPGTYADNGVSEILLLDDDSLLVLERAYMAGRGNSVRLYRIDTRSASDTLALDALTTANHQPAVKQRVADFSDFAGAGLAHIDNLEGMCWGPRLPDGQRTLWVVSDDNFNPGQVTQIAVFAFSDER